MRARRLLVLKCASFLSLRGDLLFPAEIHFWDKFRGDQNETFPTSNGDKIERKVDEQSLKELKELKSYSNGMQLEGWHQYH